MSKRIILCTDGTWDKPQSDTNVRKMYRVVKGLPGQVALYDDGVGSDGTPLERLTGGALGEGLFKKVRDGYKQIANEYQPGDDLFLFGFSRGAYTARSVAGMIAICGLPTAGVDDHLVNTAFQAYRERDQIRRDAILASLSSYHLFDAKIRMVGVWDTVGSLGIPAFWGGVDQLIYGFLNTCLHPDVLNAYQALAIDERRRQFPPTLWMQADPPVAGQVLEQVWFTGVHCDVGGGYPEAGLSEITFGWMLDKSTKLEMQAAPDLTAQFVLPLDTKFALEMLHNSWNVLWWFPKSRTVPSAANLGNSVVRRCQSDDTYRPGNLTLVNGAPASTYPTATVVV